MHHVVRHLALVPVFTVAVASNVALAGDAPKAPAFEEILCWGGDSPDNCAVPRIPNELFVQSVSLGFGHGVVLLSDGTLRLWGLDEDGQATLPVFTKGVTVSAVSAGSSHNFALLSDGSLFAWGKNNLGQTNLPALGGLSATSIATGENHNLVIRSDGSAVGSGFNTSGQATPPVFAAAAQQIDGGFDHSAALLSDGTVVLWGDNAETEQDLPALGSGEAYTDVACGRNFTVALKLDGTLVASGDAAYTTIPSVPAGNTVTSVSANFVNAAFVTDDELVVVWGDDTNEQSTPPNFRPYELKSIAIGNKFLVADVERDCDENGIADRTQIAADPTLDCDENAELDSCTLADDPTLDCNENGILDVCDIDGDTELDCDGNGRFDSCEIEADADLDCDGDDILDSCEIAEDSSLDCNGDGILDGCAPSATGISSVQVTPIGPTSVVTASGTNLADPVLDVRVEITISADLGGPGEYMILRLNDTIIDYVYTSGGANCPNNQDVETIFIDKDLWLGLVPDGDAELTLRASPLVSNLECPTSNARIVATWTWEGADCNLNEIPDLCELRDGLVPDANDNDIPDSCEYSAKDDLDGDGQGDLIWWNPDTKAQRFWMLGGAGIGDDGPLVGGPDEGFILITIGDFDGDGRVDLLYRNPSTNKYRIHLMDGNSVVEKGNLPGTIGSVWTVLGTPDLNADGNADIVFYNTNTKAVNGWIMNGLVRGANGLIRTATGLTFEAFGDIDGDGDDDFIWRNANGGIRAWTMAGLTATEAVVQSGTLLSPSVWICAGAGDFNGDLKSDIVWRRIADGRVFLWTMDGTTRESSEEILPATSNRFEIQAIVDANDNMKADLVWRDTQTGDVFIWLMDGEERVLSNLVRRIPAPWKIVNTP
jgi:hypothetical protein